MELNIYDQQNTLKATVSPDDSSNSPNGIMDDNVLNMSFKSYEYFLIDVNDYVDFEGKRFWALQRYTPNQTSTVEWEYNIQFYGIESLIKRIINLKLVDGEDEPVFSLTAPAIEHVRLFVDNMNRAMLTTDWKVGDVIETPLITINYSGTFINKGLDELAGLAGTERWIGGETVNLSRCEHGEPITLGYQNGLLHISKDTNENAPFFTRLFPIGSTRNIDREAYGSARLQLPNGVKYVEQNLQYGIIEHFEETAFAGIYPRRTGNVGTVRTEQRTGEDGNPFTIYYFTDPQLNFNPNDYEIAGLVKNIVFQSGDLNGRDFEVNWNQNTGEFEIITQWPYENDMQLPGGSLVPKSGDEYILYNLRMPTEYYALAEEEFSEAVQDYMYKNRLDKTVYKAPTDYLNMAERGINLTLGQVIRLESDEYFPETGYRLSRITRITRKVNNPKQADIEISDIVDRGKMAALEGSIDETKAYFRAAMGGLPDIVKSWELTTPTDTNLFSSLRSIHEFLSKKNNDTAAGLITFLKGLQVGNFESGMLGSGAAINVDAEGITTAEVDKLIVRRYAKFFELIIERLSHIGAQLILSPARMECSAVEELEDVYRCFFDTGDNGEFVQEFVPGDQARCQVFTGSETKYYWRLITATGSNYIDLSKTDADNGSGVPATGDHIVQMGNRTNTERQNAQILSSFGEDSPSYKQYAGIDSYSLTDKYITGFTGTGNKITGQVTIQPNSSGWQNLTGLPEEIEKASDVEVGGVNLLRNTAFTGDYESSELTGNTVLNTKTELLSPKLKYWTGNAQVNEDSDSSSGYSCQVYTKLEQLFYRPMIESERYVLSLRAKGNIVLKVGTFSVTQSITGNNYEYLFFKFEAHQAEKIEISGECDICEIQLERGTIPTSWAISPYDNDKETAKFESIRYMSDAIKGKTSILGGLILTSMIQLGIFNNNELQKITAGISGIYTDDDDVAFWAGGKLEDAIAAAMHPHEKKGANAVITHGGRAIFNEAIIRGSVYADDGYFKGQISIADGKILLNKNGSGQLASGNVVWDKDGNVQVVGKFESNISGNRIVIDPSDKTITMISNDRTVLKLGFEQETINDEDWVTAALEISRYKGDQLLYSASLRGFEFRMIESSSGRHTYMSPNEIGTFNPYDNNAASFHAGNINGVLNAFFKGLPTSSAGLVSGQIYRIGNQLMIVP
ncbi:hypothetical protein [Viscerimonas tarda]